ncbi:MAG: lipopolysaccharide heptosyltransferase II [Gammaproteobacteria bacterium]|nr:lipopolysaccharide heptosyltransferase II [Gammaproteobacteria bacterium]
MKILIVSPAWIGDAIMAQSLYKILKHARPECRLEVIAPSWTLPVLSRMHEVDDALLSPFNHGELRLKERLYLALKIKKKNYDQAIVLTNSLKSALVPYLARIPIRTSWLGELRYGLINDIRDDSSRYKRLMIERFAALAPGGELISKDAIPFPHLISDDRNIASLGKKNQIDFGREIITFCPGAEFGIAKRWPTYHFSVVIDHYLRLGWNTIILGSDKDSEVAAEIKKRVCEKQTNLFDLTGKTSILDAIDILSISKLVLTNDSGLMHVSAAVGAPLLALYGPTSPTYTPPLSDSARLIKKFSGFSKKRVGDRADGYDKSLFEISPEEVIQALNELL